MDKWSLYQSSLKINMKKNILIITIIVTASFLFLNFSQKKDNQKEFVLVELVSKQIPGFTKKVKVAEINKSDIDKLSQPLKALAAYYSALAGTNCDGNNCELTSALGLVARDPMNTKKLLKNGSLTIQLPKDYLLKIVFNLQMVHQTLQTTTV
jgi:hypothetical protein